MKNLTVLISGSGSNLKALIGACAQGIIPAHILAVIADRDCAGQQHALAANLPFTIVDRKQPHFTEALLTAIPRESDLIILAGFLSILPPELITKYPRQIINLHPSLLPKFGGAGMYGLRVHQAALQAGEKESGCTVHYVDSGIDSGEIIAQSRVPVFPDDTAKSLQARVQAEEHPLLINTVARLLQQ
ncbi:MAG: phosphoribosylglycinamide formyltransferase [Cardiobacteriaceae bacterium]|nr:phosphoribosylglycinamide formyltransferase [Cardiobacteriaceae bacterium]